MTLHIKSLKILETHSLARKRCRGRFACHSSSAKNQIVGLQSPRNELRDIVIQWLEFMGMYIIHSRYMRSHQQWWSFEIFFSQFQKLKKCQMKSKTIIWDTKLWNCTVPVMVRGFVVCRLPVHFKISCHCELIWKFLNVGLFIDIVGRWYWTKCYYVSNESF